MPITFIGLPQSKASSEDPVLSGANTARTAPSYILADHLALFSAAIRVRDAQVSATRKSLALKLWNLRRTFFSRVAKKVASDLAQATSAILLDFTKRFLELETKIAPLVEAHAQRALLEFLGTPEVAPILQERLNQQVASVLANLPQRFVTLRVSQAHEFLTTDDAALRAQANLEIIRDPTLNFGCAQLSGKSGTITIDWRSSLKRGADL